MGHEVGNRLLRTIGGTIVDDEDENYVYGPRLRGLIEDQLDVTKRRANMCVSSWRSEPGNLPTGRWMEQDERGRWGCHVDSAYNRIAQYCDERHESLQSNGRMGGRPVGYGGET
jgi:hypothetical protein